MLAGGVGTDAEEKRKALARVLQSDTFARADQLKHLLSYLCEEEIAGRASEITEYRIGVEALGKPADFSPVDDASVRNRAYALRKKLERYYADEDPAASLRIGFVKGTYVPRFVEAAGHANSELATPAEAPAQGQEPVTLVEAPTQSKRRYMLPAAMLIAGTVLGIAATLLAVSSGKWRRESLDPIVHEAWGPLLDTREEVLIAMGTPAQMTLLPFDVKMEWQPELPSFPAPEALYPWYVRQHRLATGQRLYMTPDVNSPHFGDVLGATTVIRMLTAAGHSYSLLPERVVPSAVLNSRNSVIFGVPHKSEAVFKLLAKSAFQFGYDENVRDLVITRKAAGAVASKVYAPGRDARSDRVESFGLITVLPLELGDGKTGRVVVFSGDPSAGAAGAARYFTSPQHLLQLRDRFRTEGHAQFPPAYQVLIRCRLDTNLLSSFEYETHAILSTN